MSASVTNFIPMSFALATSTEAQAEVIVPVSGTLSNFAVYLNGSPGNGNNYVLTLRKNGASQATVSITIADSAVSGTDADTVTVAAGDRICFQSVPNSNPTARTMTWSAKLTP